MAQVNSRAVDVINLMHYSLLQTDFATGTMAPTLAAALPSVQFVGDSLTHLDYHLRDATWDNGRPVLATDVAFTLKLMHCPELPNEGERTHFSFIRELLLDPADPRHFTLVCRGQAPEYRLDSGDFPILPENPLDPTHSLRQFSLATLQDWPRSTAPAPAVAALVQRYQQADPGHHPERLAGCGPYQLAAWEGNHSLTLQRKKKWWGDRLPTAPLVLQARPKQLQFLILPDDAAATLALRRHELDLYPQVSARDFQRLQASATAHRELAFYSGPSYDIVIAGFNTRRPAFQDKLTRQALSCLFDAKSLLAGTQLGQGSRTVGLLPPTSPFYNDSLPLPAYAPARAVALLRQAGWQQIGGTWKRAAQQLAFSVRYRADETTFETVALQFRAAAAAVGIPVALRPTEASTLTEALRQGDFDVCVRKLKGNPFAFNFLPILHSQSVGEGNFTGFGTPASDRLLEAIAAVGQPGRKRLLLKQFQMMLQKEAPLAPLFVLPYRLAADRHLVQVYPSGLRPGYSAATLTWAATPSPDH
ncbi:ABC transporter substrate-binding protein [Hymenobacter ginkgonis]|nr:ABC transporter substrate-binding protein [Hymenobacter ginkgonis]